MNSTADQIKELRERLDALAQVQTQEDFDEGARLHHIKNAPWVSGMYSHLPPDILNPVYVFKAYPKSLYHIGYAAAMRAVMEANSMLVSGSDMRRELAVKLAMAELDRCVCLVQNEAEERLRAGSGWAASPTDAERLRFQGETELANQAGHLNYEDRNLIGKAKEEREEADRLAEEHLVDVSATLAKRKPGRPAKEMSV